MERLMVVMTHIIVVAAVVAPWEAEASLWAVLAGIDPVVAVAVANTETGDLPELGEPSSRKWGQGVHRDNVVVAGNYGRFQVNCSVWLDDLGLNECTDLLDRGVNIRSGVHILSKFQARFKPRRGKKGCKCGGRHHWTAHYNEGTQVEPGGSGEDYGRRVAQKIRGSRVGKIRR